MTVNEIVAGIDAGSTAIKLSLFDGQTLRNLMVPASWNPGITARELLQRALAENGAGIHGAVYIMGTGYGRVCLDFIDSTLTEITCHARGAGYLCPGVRTVIDVGGQDAKAMRINTAGRVEEFIMNDKCAAGTGRFMQVMANRLGMDVAETGNLVADPAEPECVINSMCTVFAESEVIGLIHRGFSRAAIMQGLMQSIAGRIAVMAARVNPLPPVAFTGGLAHNRALRSALENKLGFEVRAPHEAVYAGSIGAALFAWDKLNKKKGE